eukprot:1194246-Prorocentrum_minimum.AAC.6
MMYHVSYTDGDAEHVSVAEAERLVEAGNLDTRRTQWRLESKRERDGEPSDGEEDGGLCEVREGQQRQLEGIANPILIVLLWIIGGVAGAIVHTNDMIEPFGGLRMSGWMGCRRGWMHFGRGSWGELRYSSSTELYSTVGVQ